MQVKRANLEEVDELLAVRPIREEEIDAVVDVLDVDAHLVCVVLKNELL